MEFIDKFWNRDIAHHPLNWLIVVVIVILFCFVLDAGHTLTGAPKPVTQMRQRNNAARNGVAQRNQSINDVAGAGEYTPDLQVT